MVTRANVDGSAVPPGALVSFIQRGLQYLEIESHLKDDGTEIECDEPFSLLSVHQCKLKKRRRKRRDDGTGNDAAPMDEDDAGEREPVIVSESEVTVLGGHESEVFMCAWSPTELLLASGSGDSTARIWALPPTPSGAASVSMIGEPLVLHHVNANNEPSRDITTLDWRHDGALLATGSIDGLARIWSADGRLVRTLSKHRQPIFSLRWNRSGNRLLSGAVDKSAVVWDVDSGEALQQYAVHEAPTLDVDWRDDDVFATCSSDRTITVCRVGEERPMVRYTGHQDEVNAIRWDPTGRLLASCSDDHTAKVWSLDQAAHVLDLRSHTKEIYTIQWAPAESGPPLLASASFDATIKLWDVHAGRCMQNLTKHRDAVYSVAFSPDGQYLASGSSDQSVMVWSVRDGALIKTFTGRGGIFEVCWDSTGSKIAACFSNATVCVFDLRT